MAGSTSKVVGFALYLGPEGPELLDPVVEGQYLGGAHKRKVQGVEEKDEVLPPVVAELELLHFSIDDGGALPVGSGLGDQGLGPRQAVTGSAGVGVDSSSWNL